MDTSETRETPAEAIPERKPYHQPIFTSLGTVAQVTHGASQFGTEPFGGAPSSA